MSAPICGRCHKPSATIQPDLFVDRQVCLDCQTKERVHMMLDHLADEYDAVWPDLPEWEQKFLASVRQQFAKKGELSVKQYQALERIYEKHN